MRLTSTMFATLGCTLLSGCPDRTVSEVFPEQGKVETLDLPAAPTSDVDILFLIDNSGSMAEEQSSLRANFGKFMDVLSTLEGGTPNLHIGVATSNLGQSATDGTAGGAFGAGCAGTGDDGGLRTTAAITGRFIIDEESAAGARNRNYSGTLADAFSALADVGTQGCGIEQHLGAVKRTLANPLNAGFLRPNAKLAVVFIADEDDCSLAHKALFEGTTDGTEVNFRCTREGIECDGGSDLSLPGLRTNCYPKADSQFLADVDTYVDYLKGLKPNPKDVIVAGIVGDPDPFEIIKDSMGKSVLKPSCSYSGQFAYPAVRTADFLSQFQFNVRETICNGDLSGALVKVGDVIKDAIGDPCFDAEVTDLSPDPGLQADCTVSDVQVHPDGSESELGVISACDATRSNSPCWHIEQDTARCYYTETKLAMVVERGGLIPPSDVHVKASCVTTGGDGQVQ